MSFYHPRETRIQTSAGSLWHCVYGGDKPGIPLLVLHGGPGFLSMPETVCELGNERPVHFYDQLGCGQSDKASDPSLYTPEGYVRELADVRQALGLDEVCLMGFSWGAMLAGLYLLNEKPTGVKAALFCGPLLSSPAWERDQRAYISRMPQEVQEAIFKGEESHDFGSDYQEAMMAYYRRHLCRLDPWPDFVTDALEKLNMEIYSRLWGQSEFTISGMLKEYDLMRRLHEIEIPVLLTCGDFDEAGVKTVRNCQMAMPNAGMAVLPDTSHLHHIEKPELFLMIVRNFLEEKL